MRTKMPQKNKQNPSKTRFAVLLAVTIAMLATVLPAPAVAQTQPQSDQAISPTHADIEAQDRLIAAQEALLNVYRCMFWIDVKVVPRGCDSGKPLQAATQPGSFQGTPTNQEAMARQQLIGAQEVLLNTIRCRFGIDTQIVPGGCSKSGQAPAKTVAISLHSSAPSGRCEDLLADGVYDWERCAWRGCELDEACNPQLSEATAQHLIELIWREVSVAGKSSRPPTNQLDPKDTFCTLENTPTSCYDPSEHHIHRIEGDLQTVLHETAHALVRDSSLSRSCDHTHDGSIHDEVEDTICSHHDLFRCVTDYLYQRYAGVEPAGVCGTTLRSQQPTTISKEGWKVWRQSSSGHLFTRVEADFHTRPQPYEDSKAYLGVQCINTDLDVYLDIGEGVFAERSDLQGRVRVAHVFLTPAELRSNDWPSDFSERATFYSWEVSSNRMTAFMPDGYEEDFINTLTRSGQGGVAVVVWDSEDEIFGTFRFISSDAKRQIRPVTESCDWTWTPAGTKGTETTWNTAQGDYGSYAWTRVDYQNRPEPYQNANAWLHVRCNTNELEVYLVVERDVGGRLNGQSLHNGRIPVSHVVLTEEEHHDTQHRTTVINTKSVQNLWSESISKRGAFMPSSLHETFINNIVALKDRYIYLWVTNADGNQFGSFIFRSVNARPHVVPITEQCGWTWS